MIANIRTFLINLLLAVITANYESGNEFGVDTLKSTCRKIRRVFRERYESHTIWNISINTYSSSNRSKLAQSTLETDSISNSIDFQFIHAFLI